MLSLITQKLPFSSIYILLNLVTISDLKFLDANTAHNFQFLQGEGFTHIVNCAASLPNYYDDVF